MLTAVLARDIPAEIAREMWVHLLPCGTFKGRDGRGPWTVSDATAVLATTASQAAGQPLPVDYDHQLDYSAGPGNGGTAPAAGWIKQLEHRPDGVWGLIEWTEAAFEKIAAKEYRFISPVFSHTAKTGEVIAVKRAGLLNNPNLVLNAICSEQTDMNNKLAVELRKLLGLPADAADDVIIEMVTELKERTAVNSADPTRFVPIDVFERVTAQLNQVSRGVTEEAAVIAVNREVERGRLIPALRDWGLNLCQHNKAAFDSFIERTGGPLADLMAVNSRLDQSPPSGRNPTDAEAEVARHLGHAPEEVARGGRKS